LHNIRRCYLAGHQSGLAPLPIKSLWKKKTERVEMRMDALAVSNEGPGLPAGFDPADRKGLGMRIIRSFVKQIGAELRIGRDDKNQGTRITVLFR
jgi:two-component sensor histidine kinase